MGPCMVNRLSGMNCREGTGRLRSKEPYECRIGVVLDIDVDDDSIGRYPSVRVVSLVDGVRALLQSLTELVYLIKPSGI